MPPTPGELIRAARRRAGLTQVELARRAGTTQAAVSRLEGDRLSPTAETLDRALAAAGERLRLESVPASPTLLEPGSREWERLDQEKRRALRPEPDVTVEELLRRGAALSRQAARLRRAVEERPAAAGGEGDARP